MKTRKRILPLSLVQTGSVLANDLLGPGGTTLLTAGCEISDDTLKSLGRRGIELLAILENDTRSAEDIASQQIAAGERLRLLFRHTRGNDLLLDLHAVVAQYRQDSLA